MREKRVLFHIIVIKKMLFKLNCIDLRHSQHTKKKRATRQGRASRLRKQKVLL